MSANGQYVVATDGNNGATFSVSSNYGLNIVGTGFSGAGRGFKGVSVSSDGISQIVGINGGGVYQSSNGGAGSTNFGVVNSYWSSCAMDYGGGYVWLVANPGGIYLSTSAFISGFSTIIIPFLSTAQNASSWTGISVSASGQYVTGTVNNMIVTSSNYGTTWTQATILTGSSSFSSSFAGVSVSYYGNMQVAIGLNPSYVYVSTDYGAHFAPIGYTFSYAMTSATTASLSLLGAAYSSSDSGNTFGPSTGLPASQNIAYSAVVINR
jgi:hypothetical protein